MEHAHITVVTSTFSKELRFHRLHQLSRSCQIYPTLESVYKKMRFSVVENVVSVWTERQTGEERCAFKFIPCGQGVNVTAPLTKACLLRFLFILCFWEDATCVTLSCLFLLLLLLLIFFVSLCGVGVKFVKLSFFLSITLFYTYPFRRVSFTFLFICLFVCFFLFYFIFFTSRTCL